MHEEKPEERSLKTKNWLKSALNGSQTRGPRAHCGSVGYGCLPGFAPALPLSGSAVWVGWTELPRPRCLRSGGSDGSNICLQCRIVCVKRSDRARPEAGAREAAAGAGLSFSRRPGGSVRGGLGETLHRGSGSRLLWCGGLARAREGQRERRVDLRAGSVRGGLGETRHRGSGSRLLWWRPGPGPGGAEGAESGSQSRLRGGWAVRGCPPPLRLPCPPCRLLSFLEWHWPPGSWPAFHVQRTIRAFMESPSGS